MLNITKVELQQSILNLHEQGWSQRRIARELGVHRLTVSRYVDGSRCTISQAGKVGRRSDCEAYREAITSCVEKGLSSERIRQDLSVQYGAEVSYDSVNRFVKTLEVDDTKRVHRMECEPGQEAQIDYGALYLPIGENGRLKKVHVLLVTLSHSRKSSIEAVLSELRELPAESGERVPPLWRRAPAALSGQPEGGGDQSRLV